MKIFLLVLAMVPLSWAEPIIIDTLNTGFHLSSPKKDECVKFDIRGDGTKECWSWPEAGSGNGWLVLPKKGKVNGADEMFGNYTKVGCAKQGPEWNAKRLPKGEWYCGLPQPNIKGRRGVVGPTGQDGYYALAEYDSVGNGGNGDGIIDDKDEVYDYLRVWIDDNPRDGIAQPGELHTLREMGIHSIGLSAVNSRKQDKWGNTFQRAVVINAGNPEATAKATQDLFDKSVAHQPLDTQTYDVWLVNSEKEQIDIDNAKHGWPVPPERVQQ
jgi:hypothetical protein